MQPTSDTARRDGSNLEGRRFFWNGDQGKRGNFYTNPGGDWRIIMMLDVMRKHSRSFIIYIFFGIIIAVFVVNMGPQSAGCTSTTVIAGKVEGTTISPTQFNYALTATGILQRFQNMPESLLSRMRGQVMDQLIVRELLADNALELGFRISEDEINDMLVKGRFLALGRPQPMVRNDDGKFDYDLFSRWVRYRFGLTVKKFKADQRRELLADKVRSLMRTSIKVSEEEVKTDYIHRNTKAELSYVRFSPVEYRAKVKVTPQMITKFLAQKKKKVESYYSTNKTAYEKLPKQVQVRILRIKTSGGADGEKQAARLKAEALHQRIKGGEAFAKVAESESDDADTRAMGGLVGWRNADSPGLGKKADKALAKLNKGQLSQLIEEEDGFSILKLMGRRQGDLKLAQVQEEIATELLQEEEAKNLAFRDAESYIKRAKAGEKLTDMFTAEDEDEDAPASQKAPAEGEDDAGEEDVPAKSPLKLMHTAAFSRSGRYLVPGIGISKELSALAFSLKSGQVADKPIQVGQMVYLTASKDLQQPDMGEWTKNKEDLVEQFLDQKASMRLLEYATQQCERAMQNKRISVNPGILITPGYKPGKEDKPLPPYVPCGSLKPQAMP